ncbi:hypothetical protein HYDPIDRAFT_27040 [Hydnomerulius pinastri MD-312]|nr:hypothetical protein HYDPIDRAFT_27040 [Hydnomerulius pinastri MD-312]
MFSYQTACCGALFALLVLANLYANIHLARFARVVATSRSKPLDHYTFVDDDYPTYLPMSRRRVPMSVEESVRFSLSEPEAPDEWLWVSTAGDHNVRLGQNDRMLSVAVTHEQHCMIILQKALQIDELGEGLMEHTMHCLNYFRQVTLCAADSTLEPPDVLSRNYTHERDGGIHECFDWPAFYDVMQSNWQEWEHRDTINSNVSAA